MMSIAKWIDHTLLKVDATQEAIENLCREAVHYGTYAVCVNPRWVSVAREARRGSDVKVCTVVGFPLGATFESIILTETELAMAYGAEEIDMVMNVGALKSGDHRRVLSGLRRVTELAHASDGDVMVKVIVESAVLTREEKLLAASLVVESGADFLKTSTGFVVTPDLLGDVELFRNALPDGFPIKAAGGIRDYHTAKRLLDMGVVRIGTSSTQALVEGERAM